jgi:hypothetical protein
MSAMLGLLSKRWLAAAVISLLVAGATAALTAENPIIRGCVNRASGELKIISERGECAGNRVLLEWNQTGSSGPAGPPGPPGASGPAGPGSAAFAVQSRSVVNLPPSYASILELDVPEGDYVVSAAVVVHNFSFPSETLAVNCFLRSPVEFSVPYSARIDPFNSATAQGASTFTIPLLLATHLSSPGQLSVQCQTNNLSGQMAFSESRSLTAIKVGSLTSVSAF